MSNINYWTFKRISSNHCLVIDASGTIYFSARGDLAAHECQDFMRWTNLPNVPGGTPYKPFGLKPKDEANA